MKNRIVVIGAGISGVGAAVLAKKKGFEVFVSDKGIITDENKKVLLNNEIEWEESNHTLDKIINANEVIKSPGIADTVDLIQKLKQKKVFQLFRKLNSLLDIPKQKLLLLQALMGKLQLLYCLVMYLKILVMMCL
jgi:UDP-N-acetylmuramoylalanine-D-glutamate ligase